MESTQAVFLECNQPVLGRSNKHFHAEQEPPCQQWQESFITGVNIVGDDNDDDDGKKYKEVKKVQNERDFVECNNNSDNDIINRSNLVNKFNNAQPSSTNIIKSWEEESNIKLWELTNPIEEFKIPPLPPRRSIEHVYSLNPYSPLRPYRHIMSEWEKQMLLAKMIKRPELDTELFQRRLLEARTRNSNEYIEHVQENREMEIKWNELVGEEHFAHEEAKRDVIFFRHVNRVRLEKIERFVARAKMWCNVIVVHVFLTALIRERKVHEALETFSLLMAPMVRRYVTLKLIREEVRNITAKHIRDIPFPTPEIIQQMYGTFFNGWPSILLEELTRHATAVYMRKGQYLMHEGDIGRSMFMITKGKVSIILHRKGKDKRRCKENSNGIIPIEAPCYVGEFALVCKEPRSASIYCETDIGFWVVLPEDYERVACQLSPEVASKQREATDVRRRQNLQKFFPLKISFLRKFDYFAAFSDESLQYIITHADPIVLHDGDFLYKINERDSSIYFIQDGTAIRRDADGNETKIITGSCLNVFECTCAVNELKTHSVISVNYCDIWRLRREILLEVGLSEPGALMRCRVVSRNARAKEIIKNACVPSFIRNDVLLNFCLTSSLRTTFYEMCRPCVFLPGERLTFTGQDANNFIVIINGTVEFSVTKNGETHSEQITFPVESTEISDKKVARHSVNVNNYNNNFNNVGNSSKMNVGADERCDNVVAPWKSAIIGCYEFAVSTSQFSVNIVSLSLTEAYTLSRSEFENALPEEYLQIKRSSSKAREAVISAYTQNNLLILERLSQHSFANIYKTWKEKEHVVTSSSDKKNDKAKKVSWHKNVSKVTKR